MVLNMTATCAHCPKPVASRGMTCDSCLGEAHRPRPKRRAKTLTPEVVALAVESSHTAEREMGDAIIPPPIVEPPVYSSKPPVGFKDDGQADSSAPLKPRLELLPPGPLLDVGRVLAYGAKKYTREGQDGADNWRLVSNGRTRYLGAALRHIFARLRGEILDSESGLPHMAHAATCVLFAMGHEESGLS